MVRPPREWEEDGSEVRGEGSNLIVDGDFGRNSEGIPREGEGGGEGESVINGRRRLALGGDLTG